MRERSSFSTVFANISKDSSSSTAAAGTSRVCSPGPGSLGIPGTVRSSGARPPASSATPVPGDPAGTPPGLLRPPRQAPAAGGAARSAGGSGLLGGAPRVAGLVAGAPRSGSRSLEPVPDSASLLAAGSRRCSSDRGSEGQSERSELLSVWLMREPGAGEPAEEVTARITAGIGAAGTGSPVAWAGGAPDPRLALRPLAAADRGSVPGGGGGGGLPARGSSSAGAVRAALLRPGAALTPPAALAPAPGGGLSFAPGAPPLRRERRPGAARVPGEGGALPARLGERWAPGAGARPEEGAVGPGPDAGGRPCRSLRKGLAGEGARCSRLRSASGWRWWWRWCWPGGSGFASGEPPPARPFSVSMAGSRAASSSSGGRCSGGRRRRRRAASPHALSSLSPSPARSAPRAPAPPPYPAYPRPPGSPRGWQPPSSRSPLAEVTAARVHPARQRGGSLPLASPRHGAPGSRARRRGLAHPHSPAGGALPAPASGSPPRANQLPAAPAGSRGEEQHARSPASPRPAPSHRVRMSRLPPAGAGGGGGVCAPPARARAAAPTLLRPGTLLAFVVLRTVPRSGEGRK
ncbi:PREDICTED: uncharacterized protein LOC101381234 [Odobenus rosmarus divergens]|uniref:Uncharacterized protein LOC101381234 n=1 Tax=Odobenus rosmarus divergens TaxID=9708 RepID=A0A9B0HBN6_ODORO